MSVAGPVIVPVNLHAPILWSPSNHAWILIYPATAVGLVSWIRPRSTLGFCCRASGPVRPRHSQLQLLLRSLHPARPDTDISSFRIGFHKQFLNPGVNCHWTKGRGSHPSSITPVQRLIDWLWIVFPLNCTIKWRSADGKLMSPPMNEAVLLGLISQVYPVHARIRTYHIPSIQRFP